MEPSFPTLKLRGKEHSNCTPWAQRIVDPKLSPPAIQLLDFLYGEWGESTDFLSNIFLHAVPLIGVVWIRAIIE